MNSFAPVEKLETSEVIREVWEIGFTILSYSGDCPLFRQINEALDRIDIGKLCLIREACRALPEEMSIALRLGDGTPEEIRDAVAALDAVAGDLLEGISLK